MNNKMAEKIKKLLNLANSCNENEAKLAAEKANEIMTRYNLSICDVQIDDYSKENLHTSKRATSEWKFIMHILDECFFVTTYKARCRKTGITTMQMYGTKTNTEIAGYIAGYLKIAMPRLFAEWKKANNASAKQRQAFYLGFSKGLIKQLKAKQQVVSDELGLVIVRDPQLNKHLNQIGCRSTSAKIQHDAQASGAGYQQGENFKIKRGLGETQSNNANRLIG